MVALGGIRLRVFHAPFHTSMHVTYALAAAPVAIEGAATKEPEMEAVFTGDALFLSGAGRFFEGNAGQARRSLCEPPGPLAELPDSALSSAATSMTDEISAGVDADEGMTRAVRGNAKPGPGSFINY